MTTGAGDFRPFYLALVSAAVLLSPGCLDAFAANDSWRMYDVAIAPDDMVTGVGAPSGSPRVWQLDSWNGSKEVLPLAIAGQPNRVSWGTDGSLLVVTKAPEGESIWRFDGDVVAKVSLPVSRVRAVAGQGGEIYALLHNGDAVMLPGEVNPVPLVDLYRLEPGRTERLTHEGWTEANGMALVADGTLFLDAGTGPGHYKGAPVDVRFYLWSREEGLQQGLPTILQEEWKNRAVQWACRDPADQGLVQLRLVPYAGSDDVREIDLFRPLTGAVEARVGIPENGCLMGDRTQLIVYEDYCGQFSCQDSLRKIDLTTGTSRELLT